MVYSIYDQVHNLYNDEHLSKSLSGTICISSYECEIKSKKLAIYSNNCFPILTVQLSGKPNGCVFNKNVFPTKGLQSLAIAALANDRDPCMITILLDELYGSYSISLLWTSSKSINVTIFVGLDQTKKFLEFNTETSNTWYNIILTPRVYTVQIPKKSAILFHLISAKTLTISKYPFRSLISTPYYYTSSASQYPNPFFIYKITGNISVKFTALDCNLSKIQKFEFLTDNGNVLRINSTGDYAIFKNQSVGLSVTFDAKKDLQNGAFFIIETF